MLFFPTSCSGNTEQKKKKESELSQPGAKAAIISQPMVESGPGRVQWPPAEGRGMQDAGDLRCKSGGAWDIRPQLVPEEVQWELPLWPDLVK